MPRIPFVYENLGDIAQRPAVIHDYLYSKGNLQRDMADKVLVEVMELAEIPWLKRRLIYLDVRIGGGGHYLSEKKETIRLAREKKVLG